MKLLVIDNYDSFTYNMVHILEPFVDTIDVVRNDKIILEDIEKYDAILISPGPGLSKDSGMTLDLIKRYASTKRILGICIGHEAIAEAFGAKLKNLPQVRHGEALKTIVTNDTEVLFKGIPQTFNCGRYHSWIIDKNTLPDCFNITAVDEEAHIMAMSHKTFDLKGIQFHPESVLTEYGKQIFKNWVTDYL